jgi:hypothetical protein
MPASAEMATFLIVISSFNEGDKGNCTASGWFKH